MRRMGTLALALALVMLSVAAPAPAGQERPPGHLTPWGMPTKLLPDLPAVVDAAAGSTHVVVLLEDGTVRAWGDDLHGQASVPAGLDDVVAVAAGRDHSLALTADGSVVEWGAGAGESPLPAALEDVVAIAAGGSHRLALEQGGTVRTWGGDSDELDVPPGLGDVVAIAAGYTHSLALTADGTVHEWGMIEDWSPEGGGPYVPMPTDMVDVRDVVAGGSHSLALTADGTVHAWGFNVYGQASVPRDIGPVRLLTAGFFHNAALTTAGEVVVWPTGFELADIDRVRDPVGLFSGSSSNSTLVTEREPFDPSRLVERLAGSGRVETAIAISRAHRSAGGEAVVLARADDFPDALAGAPLARQVGAPLLLTSSDTLLAPVEEEMRRVLRPGGRVYLLGGTAALDGSVEARVRDLGYPVTRLSGTTRFETAVAIAEHTPSFSGTPVLIATAWDFPDALAAAGSTWGIVLLSAGDRPHPATLAYLAGSDHPRYAVGSPAAAAHPEATPLAGRTREETAVAVAEEFMPPYDDAPLEVAIARRDAFADALTGSVLGGPSRPLLLTTTGGLSSVTAEFLCRHHDRLRFGTVFGGTGAVSEDVRRDVAERIHRPCG